MEMIIIKTPTTFSILATNALASTLLLYPKEATFGKKAWLMGCVIVIMQIRTIRSAAEYRPTIAGVAKKAKITVKRLVYIVVAAVDKNNGKLSFNVCFKSPLVIFTLCNTE